MRQYKASRHLNVFSFRPGLFIHKDILLRLALLAFIVVSVTFSGSGLMIHFGLLLGLFFAIKGPTFLLKRAGKFPLEIIYLNFWLLWATLTGLLVAKNEHLFYNNLQTTFLLVATVNLIYLLLSYDIRLIKIILIGILSSAVLHYIAVEFGLQAEEEYGHGRAVGFASNPNTVGIRAVYSSFVLLMTLPFLGLLKNKTLIINALLLLAFFTLILLSGSRKSFFSFAVLMVGYFSIIYANKKANFNLFKLLILAVVFIVLLPYFAPRVIEGSVLEERFERM